MRLLGQPSEHDSRSLQPCHADYAEGRGRRDGGSPDLRLTRNSESSSWDRRIKSRTVVRGPRRPRLESELLPFRASFSTSSLVCQPINSLVIPWNSQEFGLTGINSKTRNFLTGSGGAGLRQSQSESNDKRFKRRAFTGDSSRRCDRDTGTETLEQSAAPLSVATTGLRPSQTCAS